MNIIEPGHIYDLQNKISGTQRLTFFKDLPKNVEGHDGVLCQEVLRALLDRYIELYIQKPCNETNEIIIKLREVFILAEKRAFGNTLEKSYAKCGLNVEEMKVHPNGHLTDYD